MTREEIIEELNDLLGGTIDHFDLEDAMDTLYDVKAILKKANKEPETGHWIELKLNPNYECSECHKWNNKETNFCPNCGAKMESED